MKKYTGSSVVDEVRNSVGDTRNDVHANHDSDGLWIEWDTEFGNAYKIDEVGGEESVGNSSRSDFILSLCGVDLLVVLSMKWEKRSRTKIPSILSQSLDGIGNDESVGEEEEDEGNHRDGSNNGIGLMRKGISKAARNQRTRTSLGHPKTLEMKR